VRCGIAIGSRAREAASAADRQFSRTHGDSPPAEQKNPLRPAVTAEAPEAA